MARRGGSGGSGSSVSCEDCSRPLELDGSNWQNPVILATFAFYIIGAVALAVTLFMTVAFKWLHRNGSPDSMRTTLFAIGSISGFLYFAGSAADIGVVESNVALTYLYLIYYIFLDLFGRVADFLFVVIILRSCRHDFSSPDAPRPFSALNLIALSVVGLLSLATFALGTAARVLLITGDYADYDTYETYSNLVSAYARVDVTYYAVLTAIMLVAFISAVVLFGRRRHKRILLLALASISAVVYGAVQIATWARYVSDPTNPNNGSDTFAKANAFINVIFAALGVYVPLAVYAVLRPVGHDRMSQGVNAPGAVPYGGHFDGYPAVVK